MVVWIYGFKIKLLLKVVHHRPSILPSCPEDSFILSIHWFVLFIYNIVLREKGCFGKNTLMTCPFRVANAFVKRFFKYSWKPFCSYWETVMILFWKEKGLDCSKLSKT